MRKRALLTILSALAILAPAAPAVAVAPSSGFVVRHFDELKLNGKNFRFGGSNNYYLMYKSRLMVDDVFADAKGAGFTVLRTWGFLDIGNQDGSGSIAGKADGVYFQYWDGTKPAYNDGADGLERLDYVLKAAGDAGVKLVIPLTNNWRDFGGMDQYVSWRGGQYHDEFYSDPVIRGWFKDWISHVLNRTNSLTGVKYKDDPAVMTWELGNEPRCKGSGTYPQSPNCTTQTLIGWADEMTRHIKSIDRRHLASVGDEGFFCDDPASTDWTVNCGEGVDTVAFAKLPAVDVMSYHLYPDHWGKDAAWGTQWIKRHSREAARVGKPVMLGEFGLHDKAIRNPVFQDWTDAVISTGGTGFLYWILSGVQDDGSLYPDYDGFTVYCPSPVCLTLSNATDEIRRGYRSRPPVADHDAAVTEYETAVTLAPADNDIGYRTRVKKSTIDLDPATRGQQSTVTVQGGQFALGAGGAVTFTPTAGYFGKATGHYTIRDLAGRTSNVADLLVTVRPPASAPIVISSFESGTEGWAPANWQANAGTVEPQTDFATNGSAGLRVKGADGGWFGVAFAEPLDLSTKTKIMYDLKVGPVDGTNAAIAVRNGPSWTWCQSTFAWVVQNTTTTFTADLLGGMSCDVSTLTEVHDIFIYVSTGTFDYDYVRTD